MSNSLLQYDPADLAHRSCNIDMHVGKALPPVEASINAIGASIHGWTVAKSIQGSWVRDETVLVVTLHTNWNGSLFAHASIAIKALPVAFEHSVEVNLNNRRIMKPSLLPFGNCKKSPMALTHMQYYFSSCPCADDGILVQHHQCVFTFFLNATTLNWDHVTIGQTETEETESEGNMKESVLFSTLIVAMTIVI